MMKALLGILLSIGIVYGGVILTDELDLLRSDATYDRLSACNDMNRHLPEGQKVSCWRQFGEEARASDNKEKLLGGMCGLVLAGLMWMLAWFFYIKPRRRRVEGANTAV